MATITITFGDCAENHVGMEKINSSNGTSSEGYTKDDLYAIRRKLRKEYGVKCKFYRLNDLLDLNCYPDGEIIEENEMKGDDAEDAYLLIIPNGINLLFNIVTDDLKEDLLALDWDTKAKMKGKVVNKHARHNLCFADTSQDPSYEEGRGRIVNFTDIDKLNTVRQMLPTFFGPKAQGLVAEGNLYHNINKCYIGYHGDAERRIVIAARLGEDFKLKYQWYLRFKPVGPEFETTLSNGDLYIMSEKAVGYDWRRSSILTLRHAADNKE